MKETLMEALERLGVTPDQFCELANTNRDDLDAVSSGSAVPSPRITAVLRLIKSAGRAKVAPIMAMLSQHDREWRSVAGFPAYEVSDDGFVRRANPSQKGSLRTLKLGKKRGGYYMVTLYRSGNPEPRRVHRLVCEAFHGPAPDGQPYVCHRDGTRTNNHASNLYWGSAADNAADWQRERRERITNAVHRPFTPEWRHQLRALERMGKS